MSDNDKPTQEEIFQLVQKINQSKNQQLFYWDTIRDAVSLAADQVQDKRLEVLEKEVLEKQGGLSVSSIFLDIVLSLALTSRGSIAHGRQ